LRSIPDNKRDSNILREGGKSDIKEGRPRRNLAYFIKPILHKKFNERTIGSLLL